MHDHRNDLAEALKEPNLTPRREHMQLARLPKHARHLSFGRQQLLYQAFQVSVAALDTRVDAQSLSTSKGRQGLLVDLATDTGRFLEVEQCAKSLRATILLIAV